MPDNPYDLNSQIMAGEPTELPHETLMRLKADQRAEQEFNSRGLDSNAKRKEYISKLRPQTPEAGTLDKIKETLGIKVPESKDLLDFAKGAGVAGLGTAALGPVGILAGAAVSPEFRKRAGSAIPAAASLAVGGGTPGVIAGGLYGAYKGLAPDTAGGSAANLAGAASGLLRTTPVGKAMGAGMGLSALYGAGEGGGMSAIRQAVDNGKLDPGETGLNAAFGGLLGGATSMLGRGARKGGVEQLKEVTSPWRANDIGTEAAAKDFGRSKSIAKYILDTHDDYNKWLSTEMKRAEEARANGVRYTIDHNTMPASVAHALEEITNNTGLDPAMLTAGDKKHISEFLKNPGKNMQGILDNLFNINTNVPAQQKSESIIAARAKMEKFLNFAIDVAKDDKAVKRGLASYVMNKFGAVENSVPDLGARLGAMGGANANEQIGRDVVDRLFRQPGAFDSLKSISAAHDKLNAVRDKLAQSGVASLGINNNGGVWLRQLNKLYFASPSHFADAAAMGKFGTLAKFLGSADKISQLAQNPLLGGGGSRLLERELDNLTSIFEDIGARKIDKPIKIDRSKEAPIPAITIPNSGTSRWDQIDAAR